MGSQVAGSTHALPCIWMSAGLVRYRLCDRDFDCEHCPLDASLRGEPAGVPYRTALSEPGRRASHFPDDRLYSPGHLWLRPVEGAGDHALRLGVDAFAAAVIGHCREVRCCASGHRFGRGETVCEIDLDLGLLPLSAPLAGRAAGGNRRLGLEPARLVTEPYDDGWLLELEADDPAELRELAPAEAARERTRLDLQRFRRRVAIHLLDDARVGPSLPDGGEVLSDLRQMLGGRRYLELLRELVH